MFHHDFPRSADHSYQPTLEGFHPLNIGRLCMKGREPLFVPCTPLGCIELLERCGIAIR